MTMVDQPQTKSTSVIIRGNSDDRGSMSTTKDDGWLVSTINDQRPTTSEQRQISVVSGVGDRLTQRRWKSRQIDSDVNDGRSTTTIHPRIGSIDHVDQAETEGERSTGASDTVLTDDRGASWTRRSPTHHPPKESRSSKSESSFVVARLVKHDDGFSRPIGTRTMGTRMAIVDHPRNRWMVSSVVKLVLVRRSQDRGTQGTSFKTAATESQRLDGRMDEFHRSKNWMVSDHSFDLIAIIGDDRILSVYRWEERKMEADAYERINSALSNRLRRTNLPIRSPCGIDRIVWSVWDYIVGPELRFVWDIVPAELDQLTAPLVDETSSSSDSESTSQRSAGANSSTSAGEFITHYHENSLDPVLGDSSTEYNNIDGGSGLIAEMHACHRCLKTDCDGSVEANCQIPSMAEFVDRALKLAGKNDNGGGNKSTTNDSPQMSNSTSSPGGGDPLQSSQSTIVDSETSDSLIDSANAPLANLKISLAASTTSSSSQHNLSSHESSMILSQTADDCVVIIDQDQHDHDHDHDRPAASSSPIQDDARTATIRPPPITIISDENNMESRSSASTVENGSTHDMSDEQYVAVHTLSSEVYRAHYSDDVEFKLINVPERRMSTVAFVFAAKHRDQAKAVHSLAFVMKDRRLPWFLSIKPFVSNYMDDWIPKLKAAFFVESYEEILTRMTTELTQILTILGELETRSFSAWAFQVSDTFLSKPKLADDDFLRFCVSSHLQSQGQTVVVGSDIRKINKMLRTLGLFMPVEDRVICMHAASSDDYAAANSSTRTAPAFNMQIRYCPYLKLQGFPKTEVHFILQQLVYSPWPVCLIDMDLETVAQSLPWRRHRDLRRHVLKKDLNQILLGRSQSGKESPKRRLLSEMKSGELPETLVKRFLQQTDFLPYDNEIREGFVRQFMRHLAHRALALEVYIRDTTDDGVDRSNLRLSRLRRALDLESDGNFMTVLAIADRLRPGLTEFLMKREAAA